MLNPVELVQRFTRFLLHDIWVADMAGGSVWRRRGIRALKWLVLLAQGFQRDRLMLRASALTYVSVLSIVPFLAVAFSLLKGFGIQNTEFIRDILLRISANRVEVVDNIITYINQTNVRTLGVVGTTLLLVTAISLLSNIEASFNTIWGATRGRAITRKITEYISLILVFPLLIFTAMSLTATVESTALMQKILSISIFSEFYVFLLKLLPYCSIWIAFSFIYFYLPNTRVKPLSALYAGILAGSIWQIAQSAYITFQFGAAKYNAIYGSFAQLPLFLIWIYFSWVIVLLGAEMAYAFQNLRNFEVEAKYGQASPRERQHMALILLLRLTVILGDRSQSPPSHEQLADQTGLPAMLTRDVLNILGQAGLVGRIQADENDEECYTLLHDPAKLRVSDVLDIIARHGESSLAGHILETHPALADRLDQLEQLTTEAAANARLSDLANASNAQAE